MHTHTRKLEAQNRKLMSKMEFKFEPFFVVYVLDLQKYRMSCSEHRGKKMNWVEEDEKVPKSD